MSTGKTILLVDDDPDILEQMSTILGGQGYQTITAVSREDAEEELLRTKPDLAILDVMMEQTDAGFVLAHHLKKLHPGTPVILLTSVTAATSLSFQGLTPDMKTWMRADVIVNKPVRPEQILAEVRRLLREEPVAGHH
jgi:two-component system response regulator MprA